MHRSLRLIVQDISKLINTHTSISDASSENNCEDDFSGSDNDILGFYDE
jgi:hypothetical protein